MAKTKTRGKGPKVAQTKRSSGGPYKSVGELKRRFFPGASDDERAQQGEETSKITSALAEDLAERIRRALA